ncbi:hypothetical protein FRB99_007660 [Tulasnella sp. 403]|nr:hypothetical protein FRB99_007660 [Tulasnella sp. 403]
MASPIEEKLPPPSSPDSTIRTLPTGLSRESSKHSTSKLSIKEDSIHPSSLRRSHQHHEHVVDNSHHVDIEDAAAGAVEDDDEKHADEQSWEVDPANPRNWPNSKKWRMTAIVSAYTFVSPLASSMMAPALQEIAIGYNITNPTISALTLSIFLLAYALGPLVLAPLSEMYGRTWVLHISNLVFVAFNIACATAPNTTALIVFRFFAGLAGSAPLTIGAGSIADLFREENRAAAMGVYTLGPLIGPVVGPVAGGFITEGLSYHWVFWIIALTAGTAGAIGIPLLRETYAPVLLARRARAAGKTGALSQHTLGELLWLNIQRPMILLTRSFICFILSLYQAVIYGIMYLMFVTFPQLYSEAYGWGAGVAGLAYLGPGVGFLIGTVIGARTIDRIYAYLKNKHGGEGKPEYRIPIMLVGSILLPIGLLWYGWSADRRIHWIMPIIGSGVFGMAMMLCFLPMQVYLVDSFKFAASAVAAATLLRSLFGFAFPLFADRIFDALGVGGGYSLVAGIAVLVGWPFPLWIYLKGEQMRARSALTR